MTTSEPANCQPGGIARKLCQLIPWMAAPVLMLLPQYLILPLRDALALVLQPGQKLASGVHEASASLIDRVRQSAKTSADVVRLEEQSRQLASQVQRLELALKLRQSEAADEGNQHSPNSLVIGTSPSLLSARPIAARVLGEQARGFLERQTLLDTSAVSELSAGALVLGAAVLDLGADTGLDDGDLVLAGQEVWGQLISVGRHTSTARHVTHSGFRVTIQLVRCHGEQFTTGPRGLLEGSGESLCRIRLIAVTEPVAIGDVVLADVQGVPTGPLRYGRVVRVECPHGATHWEIWMEPAATSPTLHGTVAILHAEINPARMTKSGDAHLE